MPRLNEGVVELVDISGRPKLSFRPPYMVDASGHRAGFSDAVSFSLAEQVGGGFGLTLRASRAWLDDPSRQYPVMIDPTLDTEFGLGGDVFMDCFIDGPPNGEDSIRGCDVDWLDVGHATGLGTLRGLMRWNVSDIPPTANVTNVEMVLGLQGSGPATPWPISLHEHTHPFTKRVSWNKYNGTNPWPLGPGGQFVAQPITTATVSPGQELVSFFPTGLVADWISGEKENDGLFLKAVDEATLEDYVTFFPEDDVICGPCGPDPEMYVDWRERLGLRRLYTFESQQLTDRLTAHVNVGNGNLVLEADDLNIAGTGLDLSIGRYFNNLQLFSRALGNGWSLSTGQDVFLTEQADGSVLLTAPSFFPIRYVKTGPSSYTRPTAIDATLVGNSGTGWTLTFHADGSKWIFNGAGQLTAEQDRNGNQVTYTYTSGRVTQITDTQGRNVTLTYNAQNLLETVRDWQNRTTTYGYTSGYLTSVTDADNKITGFTYDGTGNLIKICDPRGNRTLFTYGTGANARRLATITRVTSAGVCADATGTGPTTSFLYGPPNCTVDPDPVKRCVVVRDPRSNNTTYQLDNELRARKVTDALGKSSTLTYTGNSDLLTRQNHGGNTWTNEWSNDGNDNLKKSSLPTGAFNEWTYPTPDPGNPADIRQYQPLTAKDQQGNITKFTYDANGNVTEVENAPGDKANYAYNLPGKGTLKNYTDFKRTQNPDCPDTAPKPTICYGYDPQGNLTSIDYPAPLGNVTLTYDALSRLDTVTDGRGQMTNYDYDPLDRIDLITYQGGATIDYVYDGNGNVTSMVDNTGTTTYTYDKLNRLEQEVLPGPKTLTYGYDAASNLSSLTDQGGTINYSYNAVDLLDTMTVPSAGTIGFTYENDFDHRRTQINYPNQLTQHFAYDNSNRITRARATTATGTVFDFGYTFANGGDTGLRRTMTELGGATTTYTYDSLARLARHERSSGGPFEGKVYAYDKNSNRCAMKVETAAGQAAPVCGGAPDPNITYYSHGLADELQTRTTSGGTTTFGYDLNGNETSASGVRTNETYNAKDQLTSITPQGQGALSMSYTGPGQFKRVTRGSATFTTGRLGLAREQNAGTTDHAYEPDEGLLLVSRSSAGGVSYLFYDGLGSVVATGNSSGGTSSVARYDPFGACLANCPTGPFRWLGGLGVYFDSATSLYKMGTRYYDSALGRFTQVDPVEGGAANRYDYALQDPLNLHDPDGTDPWGKDCYRGRDWCQARDIGVVEDCSTKCVVVSVVTVVGPGKAYRALRAAGGAKGVAEAMSRSFINKNRYVRLGYGKHAGKRVFRLAIGGKNKAIKIGKKVIKIHWHLP